MADSVALATQQEEQKQQAPIPGPVSEHPAQDGSQYPSSQLPEQKAADTTPSAEQANRRSRKKDRLQAELDQTRRWDLKRKLASITADVELLSQEVWAIASHNNTCCTLLASNPSLLLHFIFCRRQAVLWLVTGHSCRLHACGLRPIVEKCCQSFQQQIRPYWRRSMPRGWPTCRSAAALRSSET